MPVRVAAAAFVLLPVAKAAKLFLREDNPLLTQLDDPLPPFDRIQAKHVVPALQTLLKEADQELETLEATVSRSDFQPGVETLVRPYSRVGERLWKAYGFAGHLQSVKDSQELRDAVNSMRPAAITHGDKVSQSKPLYQAFKRLRNVSGLTAAQTRLVELTIDDFELSGVGLEGAKREEFNNISQELSNRSTVYSDNVLDSTKSWKKWVKSAEALKGLPEAPLALAKQAAEEELKRTGKSGGVLNASTLVEAPGSFLLTLDAPSAGAVLTYVEDPELRKEVYTASIEKASELLAPDNTDVLRSILELRQRKAEILGFKNYAELSMQRKMATLPEAEKLLEELRVIAYPKAKEDLASLQNFAAKNNYSGDLMHWDVSFWGHKQVKELYDIDAETLRPYFPLERCLHGLFDLTHKMVGARVEPAEGPKWHPDVQLFKLFREGAKEPTAYFYLDLYTRPQEKRGGAWQSGILGYDATRDVKPVTVIVANMRPPHEDKPALLSFGELHTLFHEFGHALQHMLTTQKEPSLAGVAGEWDAVELPSQFMEYWLDEAPWVVDGIARHYKTNEPLPRVMLQSLKDSLKFQAGMGMLGQLHMSLVDLDLHQRPLGPHETPSSREEEVAESRHTRLLPGLKQDRFLNHFSHIFAGGYAAGYYSYKWAEVLSADSFSLFEEKGATKATDAGLVELHEVGKRFADTILAEGAGRKAADVFKSFRERAPSTKALLKYTFGSA